MTRLFATALLVLTLSSPVLALAPQDAFVTQTIKADANGVFVYGIPKAGWWGFAALGVGPMSEYKGKKYSQDAVIWAQPNDM